MAKTPTPPAAGTAAGSKAQPRLTDKRERRFASARLNFLKVEDHGALLGFLRAKGLTDHLVRTAGAARLWFDKLKRLDHTDSEAEEGAVRECVRPQSQTGGPILPLDDEKELKVLLEAWETSPEAAEFLQQ